MTTLQSYYITQIFFSKSDSFVTHYSAFVEDNTDVYKTIKQLENTDTETMGNHGSVIVHCRPWIGLWDYLHPHNSALSILQPFLSIPVNESFLETFWIYTL